MSTSLKVTVLVEKDGIEVRRLVRRLTVIDALEASYTKVTGGGYVTLPTGELAELQVLVVESVDQQTTLRLDAQSDAGIVLNAGGFLVVVDGDIDAAAATNAKVDNSSGSDALLHVIAGGT